MSFPTLFSEFCGLFEDFVRDSSGWGFSIDSYGLLIPESWNFNQDVAEILGRIWGVCFS